MLQNPQPNHWGSNIQEAKAYQYFPKSNPRTKEMPTVREVGPVTRQVRVGSPNRMTGVRGTKTMATRVLVRVKTRIRIKHAAQRVSSVTHRVFGGRGMNGSFCQCHKFPNRLYVSVGRRIIRNDNNPHHVRGKSVIDLSINTVISN